MARSSFYKTSGFVVAVVVAWRLASEIEHARREGFLVRVRARARVIPETGSESHESTAAPVSTASVSAATIDVMEVTTDESTGLPLTPLVRAAATPPQVAGSPLHAVPDVEKLRVVPSIEGAEDEFAAAETHEPAAQSYFADPVAQEYVADHDAQSYFSDSAATGTPRVYPSTAAAVASAEEALGAEVMVPTGSPFQSSIAPQAEPSFEDPFGFDDEPTVVRAGAVTSEVAEISAALDRSIARGTAVHEATIANALERVEYSGALDDVDDECRVPRAWPWLLLTFGGIAALVASFALPFDPYSWGYASGGVVAVIISFIGSRYGSAAARARAAI